jgi:hypothetical protein
MAEPTVEELQAELAEKERLLKAQSTEAKAAFEARDTVKAQLQAIEDERKAAEQKALEEQGQFQELATTAQAKVTELTGQFETVEEERKRLEAQIEVYKERDKAELATLLEKVPEAMRAKITKDTISLEDQLDLARDLAVTKPTAPGFKGAGDPPADKTLQDQYDQAVKDGNVMLAVSLKNKMFKKE